MPNFILVNHITLNVFASYNTDTQNARYTSVTHGRKYPTIEYARNAKKLLPKKVSKELIIINESEMDILLGHSTTSNENAKELNP